jgi:hypothetical protein
MNTYRIKGNDISEIINGDYIKINNENQTEIWLGMFIVAILSKDISVFKIA